MNGTPAEHGILSGIDVVNVLWKVFLCSCKPLIYLPFAEGPDLTPPQIAQKNT